MHITHFHLSKLPPQRWRNGGGVTREILAYPAPSPNQGTTPAWDWRVSLADNAQPGPFSAFADVQRSALLFAGGPLTLLDVSGASVAHFAQSGDVCCFDGGAALHSQLPQGAAQLLNVMTRRGRASAELAWHTCQSGQSSQSGAETRLTLHDAHSACVLLAAAGRWQVELAYTRGTTSCVLHSGGGLYVFGAGHMRWCAMQDSLQVSGSPGLASAVLTARPPPP